MPLTRSQRPAERRLRFRGRTPPRGKLSRGKNGCLPAAEGRSAPPPKLRRPRRSGRRSRPGALFMTDRRLLPSRRPLPPRRCSCGLGRASASHMKNCSERSEVRTGAASAASGAAGEGASATERGARELPPAALQGGLARTRVELSESLEKELRVSETLAGLDKKAFCYPPSYEILSAILRNSIRHPTKFYPPPGIIHHSY